MSAPTEFAQVTALTKANLYFDGRVVSHTLRFSDGSKKTLGVIFPGEYHFNTDQAELMEIVAGECQVKVDGAGAETSYGPGQSFSVPAKSGFSIKVAAKPCEYVCSFLS